MTMIARLTIDAQVVSPTRAIVAASRGDALVIITGRMYSDLADELGSDEAANRHLLRVVENVGKPIGINFETGEGASSTAFVAPRTWSAERLRGWVVAKHEEIEALFGTAMVREGL